MERIFSLLEQAIPENISRINGRPVMYLWKILGFAVLRVNINTAYALEARQTVSQNDKSRFDLYAEQVVEQAGELMSLGIKYMVVDAYYFKKKFVSPVVDTGLQIFGKLRTDAYLVWPYTGPYSGKGGPKTYDGKVNIEKDLKRFNAIGKLATGEDFYTARLYSKCLKWCIISLLCSQKNDMPCK